MVIHWHFCIFAEMPMSTCGYTHYYLNTVNSNMDYSPVLRKLFKKWPLIRTKIQNGSDKTVAKDKPSVHLYDTTQLY